jgi:hypothetical protein
MSAGGEGVRWSLEMATVPLPGGDDGVIAFMNISC